MPQPLPVIPVPTAKDTPCRPSGAPGGATCVPDQTRRHQSHTFGGGHEKHILQYSFALCRASHVAPTKPSTAAGNADTQFSNRGVIASQLSAGGSENWIAINKYRDWF